MYVSKFGASLLCYFSPHVVRYKKGLTGNK